MTTFSGVSSATTAQRHEEEQQLGVASVEKIEAARRDQRGQAEAATHHDGGDITGEWAGRTSGRVLSGSVGGTARGADAKGARFFRARAPVAIYHLRPCLTVGPRRISAFMASTT